MFEKRKNFKNIKDIGRSFADYTIDSCAHCLDKKHVKSHYLSNLVNQTLWAIDPRAKFM